MGWKILVPFRTTKVCSPNRDLQWARKVYAAAAEKVRYLRPLDLQAQMTLKCFHYEVGR